MAQIIKRDSRISELDIGEIRKALEWAAQGLEERINYLEIEAHVEAIYTDRISTEEIQKSLIEIALKLTSHEHPEWRILAARLMLMELYKESAKTRGYLNFGYGDYYEFIIDAVKEGLYDERIMNSYSKAEIETAGKYINPSYDLDFDYAGINMTANRYLIKNRKNAYELPQEMFMSIALLLASNEKEDERLAQAFEIYDRIAGRKISLATPILINLRRPNGNLSSCFVTAVDDSLDSIFYNISTIAHISKNGGGVGINLSRIRATGAEINKTPNASGGVLPWIKIINDTAVAVNQLGKRAGAVTAALDIWHLDIEDFLELQTENGDQRKKAYDIFPQIVIPDLFMERVQKDENWTLVDPNEIRLKTGIEIAELFGEEFEKRYRIIENDSNIILKKTVKAKDIFKKIMKTQIETGMPYLFFKDTVNSANPNSHDGMIGSGNLCQESFSNFRPAKINEPFIDENGDVVYKSENGIVHTCNLVSINLSNVDSEVDLEKSCSASVRILDNTIDLTKTPIQESNIHNEMYRTIGVGAMGLADYLAKKRLRYGQKNAIDETSILFEKIAYFCTKESMRLSKMRGPYPKFKGSKWSYGILFGKTSEWFMNNSGIADKWLELIGDIKVNGIRNGQIMAIAPNTSSALVQGCTPSVLPVYSKFYIDKNAKGAVPICPPFLKESFWYYIENKNIDQREVVDMVSAIQNWVDQGISFEMLYNLNNDIKAKDIYETIMKAWKKGCKTIYYTRTIQKNSNIIGEKEECVSCAN